MDRTGWNVYQGKDAGMPHLFEAEKWYFSPIEDVGEVFSHAYDTQEDAEGALDNWIAQEAE
jgi:hypothetical protein